MARQEGGPTDAGGVRSVRRALEIMSLFSAGHPIVSLREVVTATGLPRTTAIRLIDTLADCGLLWAINTNEYIVGPSLLRWNGLAAEAWQLPLSVRRAMERLAYVTRETATLFVRQAINRVCIGQVQGSQALRQVTPVGREHPMWAGAPAKVLLVGLDENALKTIAAASPKGPSHAEQLRAWAKQAEEHGYAVSHGEREDGLSVVAVPVHNPDGTTIAALAVAGPKDRFSDIAIRGFLKHLREAATAMRNKSLFAFADTSHLDLLDLESRQDQLLVTTAQPVDG